MLECTRCRRHVRIEETNCPFCGASVSMASAPGPSKLGLMALSAGLSMFACTTDPEPTTTMVGDEGGSSTTDANETGSETGVTLSDTDVTSVTDSNDAAGEAYGSPEFPCEEYGPWPLMVGNNAVAVDDINPLYLWQTCGGVGSTELYSFTAPADGDYEFAVIDASFPAVLSLVGYLCEPPEEFACSLAPETITRTLSADETVHVLLDTDDASMYGDATLSIVQN